MENKLNEEQDNDQSWRDEYREISGSYIALVRTWVPEFYGL